MSTISEIKSFIANTLQSPISSAIPTPYPLYNTNEIMDKPRSIEHYIEYMFDRTTQMFEYSNLPETIPAYMLELYLQSFGYAAFTYLDDLRPIETPKSKTPSGYYILFGSIGGERDIYYRPKLFIPANPRIPKTIQSTILYSISEKEQSSPPYSIIIKNDTQMVGLYPLFSRYAHQLTENDISIRSAQINARAQVAISTSTDADRESALKYLDDLEAGKLGILGTNAFLDGISVSNISTQSPNTIIQLIELQQYLKASWFNELGLNVNFNMKREYMSEEEIAVNTDILLPLIDDMYQCRQQAVAIINSIFGLNIEVRKSSAWANKEQEDMAALAEASQSGGIELPEAISSKIVKLGGEENQSTEKPAEKVHPDVQKEPSEEQTNGYSGQSSGYHESNDTGQNNESEHTNGDETNRQDEVSNNQIVNVTVIAGSDITHENIESETPEKQQESDNQ